MDAARLHLDTLIAPTRSLPVKGFAILMGVLIAINLAVGAVFFLMGATPVPLFLGVDVAAISVAFSMSYRRASRGERVQVTSDQVRVLREHGDSADVLWTSPTAFTRVALEPSGRYGLQVSLRLSGKRLAIGAALSPQEREGLARAVDDAIRRARAERHAP